MHFSSFDVTMFLINDFTEEHKLQSPNEERLGELALVCDVIDNLANQIDADGVESEIDEDTNSIEISLLTTYAEIRNEDVGISRLIKYSRGFRIEQGTEKDGELARLVFVFDSVW